MEEVRYFGRLSLYALIVGVAYWFLSYEPAGTVLLIGFGLATGAAFLVLRSGARQSPATTGAEVGPQGDAHPDGPDGPFADESGPVPTRSGAPLAVGFGIAAIALAGAFGPWFLIAGAVPLLLGAADWLRAAEHELALRSSADETAGADRAEGLDGDSGSAEGASAGDKRGAGAAASTAPASLPAAGAQTAADASSRR